MRPVDVTTQMENDLVTVRVDIEIRAREARSGKVVAGVGLRGPAADRTPKELQLPFSGIAH